MYNFHLDSEAILNRLEESRADGMLQADIPLQMMLEVFGVREPGKVQMFFQQGRIVTCSLTTASSVLLSKKEQILQALSRMRKLHWQLTLPLNNLATPIVEAPPARQQDSVSSAIPYRTQLIRLDQFSDVHERKVYQLIDGQRSIERIAVLACLNRENTLTLIRKLQGYGIVGIINQ